MNQTAEKAIAAPYMTFKSSKNKQACLFDTPAKQPDLLSTDQLEYEAKRSFNFKNGLSKI